MLALTEIILVKYPDVQFMKDVIVRNDGPGDYIFLWNRPEPKPTAEELTQWSKSEDLIRKHEFRLNKIANKSIYDQLDSLDRKSIRPLREGNAQKITDIETEAAELRSRLLPVSQ